MYRRILETDEAIRDLSHISYEAYKYTGDKNSGFIFLKLYDVTIENMAVFTEGFSKTGIGYRGYVIHILPFGNYNLFYVDELLQDTYIPPFTMTDEITNLVIEIE